MYAFAENSGGGGKMRCSFNRDSIFVSAIAIDSLLQVLRKQSITNKKAAEWSSVASSMFCDRCVLLGQSVVLVIHRDVVLPLFRNVVFREYRGDRTRRLAGAAVYTFARMDIEHCRGFKFRLVLLRVDGVPGTSINARRVLRVYTRFANNVSHHY